MYQLGPLAVLSERDPEPESWHVRLMPHEVNATYAWWNPTTADVLEAMAGIEFAGRRVLDFGCGASAILALAAQAKGAEVVAYDYKPAMAAAAMMQGVTAASVDPGGTFDVILANIGDEATVRSLFSRAPIVVGSSIDGRIIAQGLT